MVLSLNGNRSEQYDQRLTPKNNIYHSGKLLIINVMLHYYNYLASTARTLTKINNTFKPTHIIIRKSDCTYNITKLVK